jgi:hypothetical protein
MSTQEIKNFLLYIYPNEKFVRKNKVVDDLYYIYRTFISANKKVVVICSEDDIISDIVEVGNIPNNSSLKDKLRPWIPGGPLQNYHHCYWNNNGDKYINISNKILNNDDHESDAFIEALFESKNIQIFNAMENVYEVDPSVCSDDMMDSVLKEFGCSIKK